MNDVSMLSPSKAASLRDYLRGYPHWPLRIDLLIDFLMHSQLLVPQPGVPIFVERDVEHSRWKRAFEDLVNAGAISLPPMDYPSEEEEMALLKMNLSHEQIGDPLDFALTIRHALREAVPLKFRSSDVALLQQGEEMLNQIYEQWGFRTDATQTLQAEPEDVSRVATWMFRLQLPRILARRDRKTEDELTQYWGWQPNEAVWLEPSELAALLKDREPLDQFRSHAQEVAQRGYDELQTSAYVAGQRYAMEKRLKLLDISFDAIELLLDTVPLPMKTLIAKGAKFASGRKAKNPYRWLLVTSEVDAKAE